MKKKICIFTSYFPLVQGGAEYQAYLIAKSLDRQKFEVFFLSFNHEAQPFIEKDGYKIYSIKSPKYLSKFGRPYFLYYFQINKILSQEKPDIVYRRMGAAIPGMLCLLKKKLNFKLIWACAHINDLNKFKICGLKNIFNNFDSMFRIYGIKHADQILVQTKDQKQLLLNNFNLNSLLFPNVHPTRYIQIDKKSSLIKILWIANFKKWKQPEYFIDLAEEFQNHHDVEFTMIGRPGSKATWNKLNKKINRLNQLEHKGELPINDVNKLLEKSHIFVNTSLYEGFPNTFIQAWMRKIPVISLHVDPDNIIKKNKIGFHSRTFDQLVEDTRTLIEKHSIRQEMGEKAQKYAFEKFSITNLRKINNLFQSI